MHCESSSEETIKLILNKKLIIKSFERTYLNLVELNLIVYSSNHTKLYSKDFNFSRIKILCINSIASHTISMDVLS